MAANMQESTALANNNSGFFLLKIPNQIAAQLSSLTLLERPGQRLTQLSLCTRWVSIPLTVGRNPSQGVQLIPKVAPGANRTSLPAFTSARCLASGPELKVMLFPLRENRPAAPVRSL